MAIKIAVTESVPAENASKIYSEAYQKYRRIKQQRSALAKGTPEYKELKKEEKRLKAMIKSLRPKAN